MVCPTWRAKNTIQPAWITRINHYYCPSAPLLAYLTGGGVCIDSQVACNKLSSSRVNFWRQLHFLHILAWCDAYLTSSPKLVLAPIPRGSPKNRIHPACTTGGQQLVLHLVIDGCCLFNKRTHFSVVSKWKSTERSSRVNDKHLYLFICLLWIMLI